MLKIGFVDDENTNYEDYATRLQRRDIQLLLYEGESDTSSVVEWIIRENILCVFIDYDLRQKFSQNGTDLVFEINQTLPDFPCIMLTNYPEQSKDEKLVSRRLIWDREKMNAIDLSDVVDTIKNEIDVYLKRKEALFAQYEELVNNREKGQLSALEEERFLQLHSLFSKYGETDDIPVQLLSLDTNKKLDTLIDHLTKLIEKKDD